MHRRHVLLTLLTVLVVLPGVYFTFGASYSGLPLSIQILDAHTAIVEPVPTITLPPALHAGDLIDLAALPRATRIAIAMTNGLSTLPARRTYIFMIRRGGTDVPVSIKTVRWNAAASVLPLYWTTRGFGLLLAAIALLAVWRGRDRAAAGLALWAVAFLTAYDAAFVRNSWLDGLVGFSLLLGEMGLILLARAGFYVMAESMAGGALTSPARTWWRATFLVLLGLAAIQSMGGPLAFVVTGWAELMRPVYGVALTAPYLVPVALLFVSYRRTPAAHRLRLRWMLGSSVVLVAGIFLSNTEFLGFLASVIISRFMFAMAMAGFLYAVLRHRIVDLAFILNRALVYAITSSFLLGLLALLESLIERMALGRSAGLILELAVPVGLGAALSTVHGQIENIVEQYVFRRQYREETALRNFARECAFVTQPECLLDLTVEQIGTHTGAPWVALYEHTEEGYVRIRQRGSHDLPSDVNIDDLAFVKLRAHDSEVDLSNTPSSLGREGYAFPMRARGHLLGVVVVGPRSGEHYPADERELFAHVAHEAGAALFALRAQVTEERAQATETLLDGERARNATLLEILRICGATERS